MAVEQARGCLDAAARPLRAVMVQAHSPRADVLTEHLQRIHAATGVPVVLQDYPVVSGVTVTPATLLEVVRGVPVRGGRQGRVDRPRHRRSPR